MRAFLVAIGDAGSGVHGTLGRGARAYHEDLSSGADGAISKFVPDATPTEIAALMALKIGFLARTLPAP